MIAYPFGTDASVVLGGAGRVLMRTSSSSGSRLSVYTVPAGNQHDSIDSDTVLGLDGPDVVWARAGDGEGQYAEEDRADGRRPLTDRGAGMAVGA